MNNSAVTGNVGVGNTGTLHPAGGVNFTNSSLNFSAGNTGQFSQSGVNTGFTGPFYNVASVSSALNTVNSLNSAVGALPGTPIVINGTTTINASAGTLDPGTGYRVFKVTSFNSSSGNTLTFNADPAGHPVVLNFTANTNFHFGKVVLNGLTADQVLYNVVGGSNLSGGFKLDVNTGFDNAHPNNIVYGIFLDPNGAISTNSSKITGHLFGGDSQDFEFVSGAHLDGPTFSVQAVPEPGSCMLTLVGGLSCLLAFGLKARRDYSGKEKKA